MSVRERALQRLADEIDRLSKELPGINRAAMRRAAASGAWGASVVEMTNAYTARMKELADFCVEQHAWEIEHDPWPKRDREKFWRDYTSQCIDNLSTLCAEQYDSDTKNISALATTPVSNEMRRLLHEGRVAANSSAKGRIGSRAEEAKSSIIKRVQKWTLAGLTHAAAAAGGWLLHWIVG